MGISGGRGIGSGRRGLGDVVVVSYPYSDLSRVERRPAVVIAWASQRDWLLCQLTTNPHVDRQAIELNRNSFETGALRHISYARPGKLFTAEDGLITRIVGSLRADVFNRLIDSIIHLLNQSRIRL